MLHHSIVLVEPLPASSAALRRIIESDHRHRVVAEARSAHEALDKIDVLRPALALVDARLPGLTGLHLAAALRRLHPSVRVVMLHGRVDDDCRMRALQAGAAGVLARDADPGAILATIETVLRGTPVVPDAVLSSPSFVLRLVDELRRGTDHLDRDREGLAGLTQREIEVLDCLILGYPNREIGDALFLAEQTVKNYVSSLLHKLGAHTRTAALRRALAMGWAEIGPPRATPIPDLGDSPFAASA